MMEDNENNQFNQEPNNFGLPGGYFQKSANSIFNKIEWEEEHKNFPKLTGLKKKEVFAVPSDYFSKNELKLELIAYEKLNAIKKGSNFTVPQNYFEETKDILAIRIWNEVEDAQSFVSLNEIKKQNNFTVKQNYFQENETRLSAILTEKKSGKVISLFSKRLGYAIAATLVVAFGIWTYTYYFETVQLKDCGTIACVDKIDLVKTKNLENLDNEELYELVNPKDLEKKLEKKENNNSRKNSIDSSLKDVSTEDLLDEI